MKSDVNKTDIADQDIALDAYLRTLLEEIPDYQEQIVVDGSESISLKEELIDRYPVNSTKNVTNSVENLPSEKRDESITHPLAVMPTWVENEFQALIFKLDQLVLAVPLTELLRTIKIEKSPTPIPNQPSWFMGLLDEKGNRIGVLDTGQLIFGRHKGALRDLVKQPFNSILISQDGRWGLACDEIVSIKTLNANKVRWRTLRKKRPWLVGTMIDDLIAVIDINQLVPRRKEVKNNQ